MRYKTHVLKIAPEYFAAVVDGYKTFEVRKDDRRFKRYDTLRLREWNGKDYTGREVDVIITYILPGDQYGIWPGYVVLGISRFTTSYHPDIVEETNNESKEEN